MIPLCLLQRALTVIYLLFGKRIPIEDSSATSPFIVLIARKRS